MINYLKQYADKTYEELVNSLIWFDLSLKLKAIFAKIPTTFKTINDESIIGEGNIEITSGVEATDLQGVLDSGSIFSYDSNFTRGEIASGTAFDRQTYFQHRNNEVESLAEQGTISVSNDSVYMQNVFQGKNSTFNIYQGDITLDYTNEISDGITQIKFNEPTEVCILNFPAKTRGGTYTISAIPDTIYTVSTLPIGVLNDVATVSDATAPTYLGVLVGGGTIVTPVWHNGTSWRSR